MTGAYGHGTEPENDHGHRPEPVDDHDHGADIVHEHGHEHASGVRAAIRDLIRPHSHDAASKVDSALESDARGVRALEVSLVALLVTGFLQLIVVLLTNSVALLSDTLHNFSDAFTSLPIWLAFILAQRPATRRFAYGYGRAEDLAGLVVLAFIGASALFAAYEAIDRLANPAEVRFLWAVALAGIVGFAGNELVAGYRSTSAGRSVQRRSSPMACTPERTVSRRSRWLAGQPGTRSGSRWPTRSPAS